MKTSEFRTGSFRNNAVVLLAILFLAGFALLQEQRSARAQVSGMSTGDSSPKLPDNQLDSLVAPIALYPDPLLSQALVASTYPLEIMQLQQFLHTNPLIKDKALGDAVEKQPWDPSVQALAPFSDAVTRLSGDLRWTTDLGNAFLAQPADVMAAIQRMRARAVQNGALATCEQQKVETEMVENGEQVITVEPVDPEVIYVPYYDPTMAYGALPYPYPPIYYPPPGYYEPGKALAFAIGVILGKAWNGGWGYEPSWGKGEINLNINNKYVRNSSRNNVTGAQPGFNQTANAAAGMKWQHNPVHRGGTPYSNRQLADRYGSMLGNLGGGDRLERSVPAVDPRVARPTSGPANAGERVGQHISWSHGDPGAFNGGERDVTHASSNRGAASMGGGFRGGGGGGRGGGRRR